MIITLITFLLILGLLVFVHEWGHYWVAKRSGITVHEFAFGFKPRLFGWKRGETEYAINLIPLGGYVRLEGEQEDTGKKGSFLGKSLKARAAVLVAGVVMNALLAWALLTVTYIVGSYGLTHSFSQHAGLEHEAKVVVVDVVADSPAAQAGLVPGDIIVSIDGAAISSAPALTEVGKAKAGQSIAMVIERNGKEQTVSVTPRKDPPQGQGALGIGTGEARISRAPWYKAPGIALLEVGSQMKQSLVGFFGFLQQLVVKQEVSRDVSGIVGIGAATGVVRKLGIGPLMQFTALISTNLAIINLLPILPLDGGHLFFLGIESIRKKPVSEYYRNWIALAGLVAIVLLFLIVTYHDLLRFSLLERVQGLFS